MRVFAPLAALSLFVAAAAASTSRRLEVDKRGWYPCASDTFGDDTAAEADEGETSEPVPVMTNFTADMLTESLKASLKYDARDAECAIFNAPLCHDGVCDDPLDRKTDVFFKRIVADAEDPSAYPNVWFIQGGPGASSVAMESAMIEMYALRGGKVNVYTMDHRGTGRSTRLECEAAQATVSGGLAGTGISPLEVPQCAAELEIKYGDLASFSVTTAAADMAAFISGETPGSDTFVFGVSYGTAVVERLIHLKPAEVKGYILDGIATTSGAAEEKFSYFSTWDEDFGETGTLFLEKCQEDKECKAKFQDKTLVEAIEGLIAKFEKEPESRCSRVVYEMNGSYEPPAMVLRRALGTLLPYSSLRTLIPPLVYRIDRCNDNDVKVLEYYFAALDELLDGGGVSEDSLYGSDLLYYLIVYSEMWEQPTPSEEELLQRFQKTLISNGASYYSIARYCAFSKEKSDVCDKYGIDYPSNPLLYKRDQYWNVGAKVPDNSSVLVMSSWLDPQTPHKYAEYLMEGIDGEDETQKKLVTFEHATHGVLWTTPTTDDEAPTCGMQILMSYVDENGDLTKIDTSCLERMPKISFQVPDRWMSGLLNTDDAFDGEFGSVMEEESVEQKEKKGSADTDAGSEEESEGTSYKAGFIVFIVLFAVASIAAVGLAIRLRKQKQQAPEVIPTPDGRV